MISLYESVYEASLRLRAVAHRAASEAFFSLPAAAAAGSEVCSTFISAREGFITADDSGLSATRVSIVE